MEKPPKGVGIPLCAAQLLQQKIKLGGSKVNYVRWTPSGEAFIAVRRTSFKIFKLNRFSGQWEVHASIKAKQVHGGPNNQIRRFAFSPSGRLLITGDSRGSVALWNDDGKLLFHQESILKGGKISYLTIGNDHFAAGYEGQKLSEVMVWDLLDLKSKPKIYPFGDERVHLLKFLGDTEKTLLVSTADNESNPDRSLVYLSALYPSRSKSYHPEPLTYFKQNGTPLEAMPHLSPISHIQTLAYDLILTSNLSEGVLWKKGQGTQLTMVSKWSTSALNPAREEGGSGILSVDHCGFAFARNSPAFFICRQNMVQIHRRRGDFVEPDIFEINLNAQVASLAPKIEAVHPLGHKFVVFFGTSKRRDFAIWNVPHNSETFSTLKMPQVYRSDHPLSSAHWSPQGDYVILQPPVDVDAPLTVLNVKDL